MFYTKLDSRHVFTFLIEQLVLFCLGLHLVRDLSRKGPKYTNCILSPSLRISRRITTVDFSLKCDVFTTYILSVKFVRWSGDVLAFSERIWIVILHEDPFESYSVDDFVFHLSCGSYSSHS